MSRSLALSAVRLYYDNQQRIAGVIHDGFVQYCVGAKMWLESLEEEPLSEEGKEAWATTVKALTDGVDAARHLISQLRPHTESGQTVEEAIYQTTARYRSNVAHEVELTTAGECADLDEDTTHVVIGVAHDLFAALVDAGAAVTLVSLAGNDGSLIVSFEVAQPVDVESQLQTVSALLEAIEGKLTVTDNRLSIEIPTS